MNAIGTDGGVKTEESKDEEELIIHQGKFN